MNCQQHSCISANEEVHFSPVSKKALSTPFIAPLSPHDILTRAEPSKIDAEVLPVERTRRESSITDVGDDNYSTSLPESGEQFEFDSKIEPPSTPVQQQAQDLDMEVTIPPDILSQLRSLMDSDRPASETQALTKQLLDHLLNKQAPESKQQRAAKWMSKSLDTLHISVKGDNVNISSEVGGVDCNESTGSLVSVEGGEFLAKDADLSVISLLSTEEKETMLSEADHGKNGDSMLMDDEEKNNDDEIMEFSKRQVKKNRRRSLSMKEVLDNIPSLSMALATSKRLSEDGMGHHLINNGSGKSKGYNGLETMTSQIDELDNQIDKSTVKLTRLRRSSVDILTIGDDDPGNSDGGEKLSFLRIEREINQCQDHKTKLVNERDEIIAKFQNRLINQIIGTPLMVDEFPSPENTAAPAPQIDRMRSLSLETETSSSMSILTPD